MELEAKIARRTTIIIAEDELLVRIGIKSSIQWEKYGFRLLGEASDGEEALEMVRKFSPHILLLDIKMPGLSGLSILQTIRDENIQTKVIVISSLDDFLSVKNAMQLGAYDYIHKPRMGNGELLKILLRIQEELRGEKLKEVQETESTIQVQLLRKIAGCEEIQTDDRILDEVKTLLHGQCYCILYGSLAGIRKKKKQNDNYDENVLYDSAGNLCEEFCSQRKNIWFTMPKKNRYIFLMTACCHDDIYLRKKAEEAANALKSVIKRFVDVDITMGIGMVQDNAEKIFEICGQAHTAWECTYFLENKIQKYEKIQFADDTTICISRQMIETMQSSSDERNIEKHLDIFEQFCQLLKKEYCMDRREVVYHLQGMLYQIMGQNIKLCRKWSEEFAACESLEELQELYKECLGIYKKECGKKYGTTVGMIVDYLHKNYDSEISLAHLSEVFHLNEHYISRVFKEETGENFLSYLNRIRIEEAKRLLLETDDKIYKVAEKTGFQSSVNFNYVFNRFEGISPKLFRENFSKRDNA